MVKPSRRGPIGGYLVSEPRACRVLRVPRATYRYRSCLDPRTELRMRVPEITQARVRYGYRKIRVLLNREGWNVGVGTGALPRRCACRWIIAMPA